MCLEFDKITFNFLTFCSLYFGLLWIKAPTLTDQNDITPNIEGHSKQIKEVIKLMPLLYKMFAIPPVNKILEGI